VENGGTTAASDMKFESGVEEDQVGDDDEETNDGAYTVEEQETVQPTNNVSTLLQPSLQPSLGGGSSSQDKMFFNSGTSLPFNTGLGGSSSTSRLRLSSNASLASLSSVESSSLNNKSSLHQASSLGTVQQVASLVSGGEASSEHHNEPTIVPSPMLTTKHNRNYFDETGEPFYSTEDDDTQSGDEQVLPVGSNTPGTSTTGDAVYEF